jgi:photosystem II stability/assembly factor-like uncharacterized protein
MRVFRRLMFLLLMVPAWPAMADTLAGPMRLPTIAVRAPAQALLISVTRAGTRLVAGGAHGLIIYSDDNGQSWHQASVPTSETIADVGFADSHNGWAAGAQGVIIHTTDGGASWQLQLTGDQVIALMNTAAAQYAAANPGADAAQRAQRRAAIFTQAGPNKPFLSVLPLGAQSAIIFGSYRMAVMTTDGGKDWTDWSLHMGDPVSHGMFDAIRAGNDLYLAGEAGVVLHSADQGQSFSMLTSPDPSTFLGLLATPAGTLLAYGVAGEVFRSTDKGQDWAKADVAASSDLTGGVVLASGKILLVSEDGSVFESGDDGLTFRPAAVNEGMALYDVAQAENGDLVFVGSGGVRVTPAAAFN